MPEESRTEDLPDFTFQDQVWLWFEVWTAERPDLRERARQVADPDEDRWGYLAELGEPIAAEA